MLDSLDKTFLLDSAGQDSNLEFTSDSRTFTWLRATSISDKQLTNILIILTLRCESVNQIFYWSWHHNTLRMWRAWDTDVNYLLVIDNVAIQDSDRRNEHNEELACVGAWLPRDPRQPEGRPLLRGGDQDPLEAGTPSSTWAWRIHSPSFHTCPWMGSSETGIIPTSVL